MIQNKTRVTFLLPCFVRYQIGGFKVVFEYANGLVQRGYQVSIVFPAVGNRKASIGMRIRGLASYLLHCVDKAYRPDAWFKLDSRVQILWVPSLAERYIPLADVVIATAWLTAEWVRNFHDDKVQRLYFVQDYEHYMNASVKIKERIELTFKMKAQFIGIAPPVLEMLQQHGVVDIEYIPNGLDFDTFFLDVPIGDEVRCTVGFPTRPELFKATGDAISALAIVRERIGSGFSVWSFGGEKPAYMPDWVEYHVRPSDEKLRSLYNHSSIFVVPSHFEGWGLPGSEAMACGAALVSTDNGGVRAYAIHEENALLSPVSQPGSLAADILRLIADPSLRIALATKGKQHIQQFTWERAIGDFDNVINGIVAHK